MTPIVPPTQRKKKKKTSSKRIVASLIQTRENRENPNREFPK